MASTAHFKGQLNAIHAATRNQFVTIAMLVSMLHVAVDDEI